MVMLLMVVLLLSPAGFQQNRPQSLRSVFEGFAGRIQSLGTTDVLHGFRSPSPAITEFVRLLEEERFNANDLRPLLRDSNAKVRTLALIALYYLEDPKVLPDIFTLVDDKAETFPGVSPTAVTIVSGLPRKERQTVGEFATGVLNMYLQSSGYHYGPHGSDNGEEPGFKEYWKTHGERSNFAGWWKVRLSIAGHGTSPTPGDRIGPIQGVRAGIDKLPEPDRTLTLLWLRGEFGADALVSDEALVGLLRKIGPETLLKILQRKMPSEDPDLQPGLSGNGPYGRMCVFILQRAGDLLNLSVTKALLDQETWERDFQKNAIGEPLITPWWAIAVAELDAQSAVATLESAYARFQGPYDGVHRLELAEALWRQGGEPLAASVVDWLYREVSRPNQGTWAISRTLDRLFRESGRNGRLLARTLIDDPRFDELNWRSLDVLARNINRWSGTEWISIQELESAWSPSGIDLFMKDAPQALKQYPKENGDLMDTLGRWRRTIREHKPN